MDSIRDWIVNHPTSSDSFNVVFWIGLVGFIISLIIRQFNKNSK